MPTLTHELRIAIRSLRRSPAFTVTAALVLAIGIGMSVAMFTVIHGVLLTRLPVLDPTRLVTMSLVSKSGGELPTGGDELDRLQRESPSIGAVAGVFDGGAFTFPLLDGDRSVIPNRAIVTGSFFDVLGARPVVGRLPEKNDDERGTFAGTPQPGAVEPLVISYHAWQAWFGGDTAIVGRHLADPYDAWQFIVVGVAPPGLDYPIGTDYWIPMGPNGGADVVARLSPTGTSANARAEFLAMILRSRPQLHSSLAGARIQSLSDQILGDVRPAFVVLGTAVGLLLLVACVNVGCLLLLRASTRGHEMAVRRAIGAGFGDLLRQLLLEVTVIAFISGLLGLLGAEGFIHALVAFAPPRIPRMDLITLSGAPIGAAAVITGITVLFFGVVPSLFVARGNVASSLKVDARSVGRPISGRRLRQSLVASQVALALIMVAGAGLLGRSLERLELLPLGYQPSHLSFLAVSFPAKQYLRTRPAIFPLGEQVFPRLRAIPGVAEVSPVIVPPLTGADVWSWRVDAEGHAATGADDSPSFPIESGDADLFRTLGVPVLHGRGFTSADDETGALVVVVSESVARQLWPGQAPIGKQIRLVGAAKLPGGSAWRTVVGVVGDLHFRELRAPSPTVFLPWRQSLWQGWVAVRTTGPLASVLPAIRTSIHEIDPLVAVSQAQTMDDVLAAPLAEPRLSAFLLSAFGLVALVLAAIGLYGVMAAAVRQQTRELGIRMALGAAPERLRRDILRTALGIVASGAAAGSVVALGCSKVLAGLLFEISPTDPIALGGTCVLLAAVGLAAAYVPARRATRIDPTQALRSE